MKLSVLIVLAGSLAGCSTSAFDDRRDIAWSDSNGSVNLDSQNYGIAVAGVTTDAPGTTFAVLGDDPLGLGVVRYGVSGELEQFGVNLSDFAGISGSATPSLVGADEAVDNEFRLVAVGGLGGLDEILLFDVNSGEPDYIGSLTSSCSDRGTNLGERMLIAQTNAGNEESLDLIALRGNELFLYKDIDPDGANECSVCVLGGENATVVGMASADVIDDDTLLGEELLASIDGALTMFGARQIEEAHLAGLPCLDVRTPLFENIASPGLETDYGAQIAVGDGDDDDDDENSMDIALSAPSSGSVYVFHSFDPSDPVAIPQQLVVPPNSGAFGSGPMAFLDIDIPPANDEEAIEGDELVIGDPDASPLGINEAGQVSVFKFSQEDGYEIRAVLHDSTPESGQQYGRAVAETEFRIDDDDTDLLVVGALNETFTLFRALIDGSDPRQ